MITATRIAVGLLWLRNAGWKTPTGFGGLRGYVNLGIEHPVFPPFSWGLEHLVLPNMTPFGFMTLLLEVSLAVTLLLGWKTRLFALLGAAQSLMIGLSVANAPNEWQGLRAHGRDTPALLRHRCGRFGGLDGSLACASGGSRRGPRGRARSRVVEQPGCRGQRLHLEGQQGDPPVPLDRVRRVGLAAIGVGAGTGRIGQRKLWWFRPRTGRWSGHAGALA
jgi:thiosulfate dehydrogenase [quinone] large subunit